MKLIHWLRLIGFVLMALILVSACGDGKPITFEEFHEDLKAMHFAEDEVELLGYDLSQGTLDKSGVRAGVSDALKKEKLQTLSNLMGLALKKYIDGVRISKDEKEISLDEATKLIDPSVNWVDLKTLIQKVKGEVDLEIQSL